jgi:DNA-binding beta-propeller fold protein YncE
VRAAVDSSSTHPREDLSGKRRRLLSGRGARRILAEARSTARRLAVSSIAAVVVAFPILQGMTGVPADAAIEPIAPPAVFLCGLAAHECPATSNPTDIFFATDSITGQRLLYAVTYGVSGEHPSQFQFVVRDADTQATLYTTGTVDPSQADIPGAFSGNKRPERMVYNPNTNQVYITRSLTSEVAILTGMIGGQVPKFDSVVFLGFSAAPVHLDINVRNNRVYVLRPGNYGSFYYDDMVVIDGNKRSIVSTISLRDTEDPGPGVMPSAIAVDPFTNRIYVARGKRGDVMVFDGATESLLTTILIPGGGPISDMALDPYRKKLYIAHPCATTTCSPVGASNPNGDPRPNENSVSVVDVASNTYLYSIRAGIGIDPRRVRVDATKSRVFVSCYASNEIVLIDGRTDAVIESVVPRKFPTGVAIDGTTGKVWALSSGFTVPFDALASQRSSINSYQVTPPPGGTVRPAHYFAEGTTRAGFTTYLTLYSPDIGQNVDVTYAVGPGQGPPVTRTYYVPGRSRVTVNVNDEIGPDKDVSILAVSRGLKNFFAERVMYFKDVVIGASDGTASSGSSNFWTGLGDAHTEYFFPEGTTRPGFREWLVMVSPYSDQTVAVTYMPGAGQGSPVVKNYFLPKQTRVTISVNDEIGPGKDVSMKVVSLQSKPFFAERPMYYDASAVGGIPASGGHNASGIAPENITDVVFPEGTTRNGFRTFYTLVSDVTQTVEGTFVTDNQGGPYIQQYVLPAKTRVTIELESVTGPEKDVSARFRSLDNLPFFAERPMYFVNVVNGASGATVGTGQWTYSDWRVQRRSDYYLAEGTNRKIIEGFSVIGGAQAYLLMSNPDATNTVTVEIDAANGKFIQQEVQVPKGRRVTVDLNFPVDFNLGPDTDYSIRVTSHIGEPVYLERAIYFNNFVGTRGATLSQGTHN